MKKGAAGLLGLEVQPRQGEKRVAEALILRPLLAEDHADAQQAEEHRQDDRPPVEHRAGPLPVRDGALQRVPDAGGRGEVVRPDEQRVAVGVRQLVEVAAADGLRARPQAGDGLVVEELHVGDDGGALPVQREHHLHVLGQAAGKLHEALPPPPEAVGIALKRDDGHALGAVGDDLHVQAGRAAEARQLE